MLGTIDFTKIRGETVEGQRSSFEQLVCHLARLDGRGGEFRRIEGAGGDAGVEAIRIVPSGKKIGYQAKFYPAGDKIDWNKLNNVRVRSSLDAAYIPCSAASLLPNCKRKASKKCSSINSFPDSLDLRKLLTLRDSPRRNQTYNPVIKSFFYKFNAVFHEG